MSDERLWEESTDLQREAETAARVARDRELKAQLAESAMRDEIKRALSVLDDMTVDAFDREARVREILVRASSGRAQPSSNTDGDKR